MDRHPIHDILNGRKRRSRILSLLPNSGAATPATASLAPLDVVLPAGGRIHGPFAAAAGTDVKALIRLGDSSVLRRTIDCLRASGRSRRIIVVGPEAALEEARSAGADITVGEGATGPENILRGLDALGPVAPSDRALVLTTDLAFLTPGSIIAFLDACRPDADLTLAVVSRSDYEGRFPQSANTYVPLRGGQLTLGCAFLVNPSTLQKNRARLEQVFLARKSQLGMARLLGLSFIIRFVCRRLTLKDVVHRGSILLGCTGAVVPNAAPELAFDIDQQEDYDYASQQF